jgi:hypothetical protein
VVRSVECVESGGEVPILIDPIPLDERASAAGASLVDAGESVALVTVDVGGDEAEPEIEADD